MRACTQNKGRGELLPPLDVSFFGLLLRFDKELTEFIKLGYCVRDAVEQGEVFVHVNTSFLPRIVARREGRNLSDFAVKHIFLKVSTNK